MIQSRPWWVLIGAVILAGCHDDGRDPRLGRPLDGTDGALACEADHSCPGGGVCDLDSLKCVACIDDSTCGPGHCDLASHSCVQCVTDHQCASGRCHPGLLACVECADDGECGGGLCDPETYRCVACKPDVPGLCGAGTCDPITLTCVGGCTSPAQCNDRDECTRDFCTDGACTHVADTSPRCCEPPVCGTGATRKDKDSDGCPETCACGDGTEVAPGAACCAGLACADGLATDLNNDGCADACVCPSGAWVAPDGACTCEGGVTCGAGQAATDLDGDQCPDQCTAPCDVACDCRDQDLVSAVPGCMATPDRAPWMACDHGVCSAKCSAIPREPESCLCPVVACGLGENAVDSDGDHCPDKCACPTPECTAPAVPVDRDSNGCEEACAVPCADDCACTATAAAAIGLTECPAPCPSCPVLGACDASGMCAFHCEAGPLLCDGGVGPLVCGCDGTDYTNSCFASQAGIGVATEGSCEAATCMTNDDCGSAELACVRKEAGCAMASPGRCIARPTNCVAGDMVCGCDGLSYKGDCNLRKAGVDLAHTGPCP